MKEFNRGVTVYRSLEGEETKETGEAWRARVSREWSPHNSLKRKEDKLCFQSPGVLDRQGLE